MLGFEIKINDEEAINIASDSSVSVYMYIDYCRKDSRLIVKGMDSKSYHLDWYKRELEIGDKIHIRVAEIDNAHPPANRKPSDREVMKERYYALKQELEDKGLI